MKSNLFRSCIPALLPAHAFTTSNARGGVNKEDFRAKGMGPVLLFSSGQSSALMDVKLGEPHELPPSRLPAERTARGQDMN